MTTKDTLLELLRKIDAGEIALTLDPRPQPEWRGAYPVFVVGGWVIKVFDDCGEWDYIEAVRAPDGEVFSSADHGWLLDWDPSDYTRWGYSADGWLPGTPDHIRSPR